MEGLRKKNILQWAREKIDVDRYIPDNEYQKESNRKWFTSLVNTLLEKDFKKFINSKWRAREQKVIKNKNLGVTASEVFIEIFKNSRSVSTSRVKTYFLARKPKERAEEKEKEKENNFRDAGRVNARIAEFLEKLQDYELKEEEASKHKNSLAKLYDRGVVDSDGEYIEQN